MVIVVENTAIQVQILDKDNGTCGITYTLREVVSNNYPFRRSLPRVEETTPLTYKNIIFSLLIFLCYEISCVWKESGSG